MEDHLYTVSSLTRALQKLLETDFSTVHVKGELGRITRHRSGHWYMVIKDQRAVLNAVMFRGMNRRLSWSPAVGDLVVASGNLDIYPPNGQYNLVIRQLRKAGLGDMQARLEALKKRLAAQGLFDPRRKKPLPDFPRAIGVATSPTGAAFRDIMRVVHERFPGFPMVLSPCRVQGTEAADEIATAIQRLHRHGRADVIIVGRGGGSAEDLWAFNEERVVRAIADCPVPVVSAVGHEVDVTLSDLAADLRAATPSHAAELVVPDRNLLRRNIRELAQRLLQASRRQVEIRRTGLASLKLKHPRRRIEEARIRCDEAEIRLGQSMDRNIAAERARLAQLSGRLRALSPLAVLERGYAIAMKDGKALRNTTGIQRGDALSIRLAKGELQATVNETA